ncbi:MAG: DNA repair exonuclease [Candidatus Methanomethylophilaceae archaeon]|jgi:DNA repair exonuclease SbcCD nuclease subunit|nr:DNA repair exonuclease [Candidatus Methanomethylophilaceae archaeon]
MGEFRFIHCADLHLGARFKGVDTDDAAELRRIRMAPLESFERIIDLAISERACFIVIAGDIYEKGALPATRAFFAEQARRVGIPIFISKGNHDSERPWDAAIPYPDNVKVFGVRPERVRFRCADSEVEVTGASFMSKKEKRNLVSMLSGSDDAFTVACVHCDVEEADEGHPNAVCRMNDFLGKKVDYWALGHIHKRKILRESPYAVYSGNIQGRSAKESGQKGAYVVTVSDKSVTNLRFVATQSLQWGCLDANVTGLSMDDLASRLSEASDSVDIASVRLSGTGELMELHMEDPKRFREELGKRIPFILASVLTSSEPVEDGELATKIRSVAASMASEGRRAYERAIAEGSDLGEQARILSSLSDSDLEASARRASEALIRMTGGRQ